MPKLKAFPDDKPEVTEMRIVLFDRVENTVGKEENAGNQPFSSFPQVFSKAFFFMVVKSWHCVVKS